MLAYGGLKNWNSVFGADTPFFKKKPWYVDSFNGGANSAQVFEAGGFRFLHIGFEMAPSDEVLKWAEGVRSEEHTSELQSLMRISYAVFCLKKKNKKYIE